jgi:hypothetical protein
VHPQAPQLAPDAHEFLWLPQADLPLLMHDTPSLNGLGVFLQHSGRSSLPAFSRRLRDRHQHGHNLNLCASSDISLTCLLQRMETQSMTYFPYEAGTDASPFCMPLSGSQRTFEEQATKSKQAGAKGLEVPLVL